VYQAERALRGGPSKSVALKIIAGERALDTGVQQTLLYEARLGNLLRHPNVVNIFDFGVADHRMYLAMEFVEGLTLAECLKVGGTIPPRVIRDIAVSVCAGLDAIHNLEVNGAHAQLVHRDIKPANILLSWDGQVKVADLGIAKGILLDPHITQTGAVRGTPSFMSPEHLRGDELDGSADLFALGAVLYEMLLRKRLFTGRTVASIALAVVQAHKRFRQEVFWKPIDAIHPGMGSILRQCLVTDPSKRIQTASALRASLEALTFPPDAPTLETWLGEIFHAWQARQGSKLPSDGQGNAKTQIKPQGLDSRPLVQRWLDSVKEPTSPDEAAGLLNQLDTLLMGTNPGTRKDAAKRLADRFPILRLEVFGGGVSSSVLACPETGRLWQEGRSIFKLSPSRVRWRFAYHILRHRGQKRAEIFPAVWEQAYRPPSSDNALHVNLYRLRKQLEKTALVFEVDEQSRYDVRGAPTLWVWDPKNEVQDGDVTGIADAPISESQLPAATDPFFGREVELFELNALLEKGRRLITVRGPPGTGKTRLCMEFIRAEQTRGQRRVWFCDLTEAKSLEGVLHAIATGTNVPLAGVADTEALITRMGHAFAGRGAFLLVFDNAEQVRDAVARVAKALLSAAKEMCVLVTSRSSLRLAEEQLFALKPLPIPQSDGFDEISSSDAVRLFVQRAQFVQHAFALTPDNAAIIRAIVTQLDGMPLAIELAASKTRMLSPAALHERLEKRFRVLRRSSKIDNDRHQTLLQALEDSWELLETWEQVALAQCSVFQGGFTLESAEAVVDLSDWPEAPWVLDVLESLLDHSLLHTRQTPGGLRFFMYRSIHDYGAQKLAELGELVKETAQHRHARWFGRGVSSETLLLPFGDWTSVLSQRLELENLIAGIDYGTPSTAAQCCVNALRMVRRQGPTSLGVDLSSRILKRPDLPPNFLGPIKLWCGLFLHFNDRGQDARAVLGGADDENVSNFVAYATVGRDRELLEATLLLVLGRISRHEYNYENAEHCFLMALERFQRHGDRSRVCSVFRRLGGLYRHYGSDYTRAADFNTKSLIIARELGDRDQEVSALSGLANVHYNRKQYDQAAVLYRQVIDIASAIKNNFTLANAVGNLGSTYEQLRDYDQAITYLTKACRLNREVGDRRLEGVYTGHLGRTYEHMGALVQAAECLCQGVEIARAVGNKRDEGITLGHLGELYLKLERIDEAKKAFYASISVISDVFPPVACYNRSTLALLLAQNNQVEEAQRLLEAEEPSFAKYPGEYLGFATQKAQVRWLAGQPDAARKLLLRLQDFVAEQGELFQERNAARIAKLTELLEQTATP
jgi:predicted ATPase/serine/threonine protein kinase/tetratricopeptide (TPR) repeat protein